MNIPTVRKGSFHFLPKFYTFTDYIVNILTFFLISKDIKLGQFFYESSVW